MSTPEEKKQLVDEATNPFLFWVYLNKLPKYVEEGIVDAGIHAYEELTEENKEEVLLRLNNVQMAIRKYGLMYLEENNLPDLLDVGNDIREELLERTRASEALSDEKESQQPMSEQNQKRDLVDKEEEEKHETVDRPPTKEESGGLKNLNNSVDNLEK